MEIFEITPSTQNQRQWKRGGYGICGLDLVGNTWFNPAAIGREAIVVALSSGTECQIHEVDGVPRMLVSIAWARKLSLHSRSILISSITASGGSLPANRLNSTISYAGLLSGSDVKSRALLCNRRPSKFPSIACVFT